MRFSVEKVTAKLQVLRFAHALAEAGGTLCISRDQAPILAYLSRTFTLDWEVGDAPVVPVEIDHATPRTSLGTVSRALIFPQVAIEHCRAAWAERVDGFTFAGLMTDARLQTLSTWSLRSGGQALRGQSRLGRRIRPHALVAGLPSHTTIWASNRGRTYPVKAWDDEYYQVLGRSQFVLCPSGEFVWTYRVFEAALCGAIPVVEAPCEAYGDLVLHSLSDDAAKLTRDTDVVEHNRREAARLVTAPPEELRSALESALR